ncbi:MAG: DUF4147 domain-containing protein [Gemmatimonadetes bacterium]|nr:DUF4147 domain-containing protein [Gemmatimonadota bacterium]MBI3568614.1 DUF4147 domain-containing protein [Gemmatimonadota bacterium]
MHDPVARDLAVRLREILAAALDAADPAASTRGALERSLHADELARHQRLWIIALGKAAPAMAGAALAFADARAWRVAGGIVVTTPDAPTHASDAGRSPNAPDARLLLCQGDHPVPGAGSLRAANELADLCEKVGDDDVVLALISGGTSSLVGAPVDGVSADAFAALHALLLGSGLDIGRMNAVRKRFSRWGAGRLAAALAPAIVHPVLLSDVPGDDPAMIGSGPCSPDRSSAADVEAILRDAGIAGRVPLAIAAMLGAVVAGALPETPKAHSSVFARVRPAAVTGNGSALRAAAARATALGIERVVRMERPLSGDAAESGRAIARAVLASESGTCLIFGGETTVRLPADHGSGGRSQQLALAAADVLRDAGDAPVALLAAGTDGIDGDTGAAGAIVTPRTWDAMAAAGIDPAAALTRCDANPALDAAGALVTTGPTGTNVADIVIALRA